ncbi:fimbrial protein [Luteibacter sp. dw_328]|uniref:fimbrial protein n=1 Tax=Luteibacter sp. dw_328 TaxID=2719796 RepID=UPI001BD54F1D|nr:fimbrial protein [Luteibacter sp. dw_328]
MNRRHIAPVAAAFLAISLASPSGNAGKGRSDTLVFDVTGTITPSCALVANRIRVDLGNVAVSELPSVGDGSRWAGAAFIGADCVGATRALVTVHATAAPSDPRYLATTGGARGVAIELRTGSGQPVLPDGTTPVRFDLAGTAPELRFEAHYVRVGPLRPGDALGAALVQITWE